MSDDKDKSQQTEEATPKRQEDARKKGQVPSSKEPSTAIIYLVIAAAGVTGMGSWIGQNMQSMMSSYLGGKIKIDFTPVGIQNFLIDVFFEMVYSIGPIVIPIIIIAVITTVLVSGPVFTFETLKPKLEKISPAKGIGRLFSTKSLAEFIKSVAKLTVLTVACWVSIELLIDEAISLVGKSVESIAELAFQGTTYIASIAAAIFIIISIVDVMYQKWEWMKGLKMSHKEIKDEYKESEGDPQLKSKIRQLQEQAAKQRMMSDVPTADVIITNPTHYAVAIKYNRASGSAPTVVAKGKGIIAQKIKEIASESNVPLRENKPLARSLFSLTNIGEEIPSELYEPMALILAEILNINKSKE